MDDKGRAVVILTGIAEREGDQFVSYCRELGTSSCGDTAEEVLDNLGEVITVHLGALDETGARERFLQERNVNVYYDPPSDEIRVLVRPGKTFFRLFEELLTVVTAM